MLSRLLAQVKSVIPYFQIPIYNIGPIPLDPWGTMVCIGFMVGMEMARARGIKVGLDVRDVIDGLVATVGFGFIFGHLVHVLAYHPEQLEEQGVVALLKIWAGFSSFGGFLGAVIGSTVFFRYIRKRPFWPHADAIMFGFPFGWVFGRLGCFLAHDHIGRQTDFFLAVQFPRIGTRFDLGLLEALWTMVIAITFWVSSRRPKAPGFFTALWCVMYAPARFGLDFLRNTDLESADTRWANLTPAQWGCVLMFLAGLFLWSRVLRTPAEAR